MALYRSGGHPHTGAGAEGEGVGCTLHLLGLVRQDFGTGAVVWWAADPLERRSVGDLVEPLALVVADLAAQASLGGPLFDRGGAHAEIVGELVHADHAACLEAVFAGGEPVAAADVADDPGGERLVGAGDDPRAGRSRR